MWMFLYVNNALHHASNIFPVKISEVCVSPDRMCPSLAVSGSCGNVNLHYLVDIFFPPFGSTTLIGGVLYVVCSWGSLILMLCLHDPVSDIPILGSTVVSGVDPK